MLQLTFKYFIILMMLGSLLGCTTARNRYLPVFHDKPRISTFGFSVSPPPGTDWFEKIDKGDLFYLKKTDFDKYIIYTRAHELSFSSGVNDIEELMSFVKLKKTGRYPETHKNISYNFAPIEKEGMCVQYQHNYEVHSSTISNPAKGHPSRVTSNGLICVHPAQPEKGIDIYYFERSPLRSVEVSYSDEAEQFLHSLTFIESRKRI
ncbi:MAG: hypothetical protein D6B25_18470 [Desulfobulbaceae bacterium]|nr:MAG: hypothetical protein D6B25_18470 [Desulfobulbaceae bacterium]